MEENVKEKAEKLSEFLTEHRCADVVIVDMSDKCSWTDAFVIATVDSVGHLRGVVRNLWNELESLSLNVNNRHKTPGEDGWTLIDCSEIVIHLMSPELREFYNLERLWKDAEKLL